ncbi:MAG: dihydrofolate reductase family protein, partial [Flavobacteriales bacterium]
GGAEIAHALMQDDLIDEWIISVIPACVGSGTKLFKDGRAPQRLTLVTAKSYDTGLTQLHYRRKE